jgi:hypothetical protein
MRSGPSNSYLQLHLTAHLALITTISTYTANWFGRLYPPVSCFLNFACLMLYIAGVAGVAAFSFMLDLLSRCNTGSACTTFKIAFLSAHLAGYVADWSSHLIFTYLQWLIGRLQWRKWSLMATHGVAGVCYPMDIVILGIHRVPLMRDIVGKGNCTKRQVSVIVLA